MQFWQTLPLVHRILLLCGIGFLLTVAIPGLADATALLPIAVTENYEIWRLLSYPFFDNSFWQLLSASLLLYFFGPEIEYLLKPRRFLLLSAGFFLAHGLLYLLLTYGSPSAFSASLSGPYAYALALLSVFAYFYPGAEFTLFGIVSIRVWVFALVFAALVVIPGLLGVIAGSQPLSLFLAGNVAGIVLGLLFSQVYFQKYTMSLLTNSIKSRSAPPVKPVSKPAVPVVKKTRTEFSPSKGKPVQTPPVYSEPNDTSLDEQRLNDILDKISASGKDSLTEEEVKFLEEYSRRL